ncbi:MAG: hypothetical protein ACREKS_10855 [Candidatus Rokuibacteriota bacterium]
MLARVLVALVLIGVPVAAPAHHLGSYTPRDNEISVNFKQLKFAIQAAKFEVAQRLFESGPVRKEMLAMVARLPSGLESRVAGSLREHQGAEAERGLVIFFAALTRDLALEAERQVSDTSVPAEVRTAAGRKFLEAIWRYYNLVDFAISQYDPKAAVAVRLAFDEAESLAKSPAASVAANPSSGPRPVTRGADVQSPERLRQPLARIAQALSGVVDSTTVRRSS